MNASILSFSTYGSAFERSLTLDDVRARAPAVFAPTAHERLSDRYTFVPTQRVLAALMQTGFVPVEARQASTRSNSVTHGRHVIRLRRRVETVRLRDAIPELVFLNSHDGTSAYQLRAGLFRAVCTNGLIVSQGALPGYCVSHRGNVVDEVVGRAVQLAERFGELASQVERMEARRLYKDEQIEFAERAVRLRWPEPSEVGLQPSQLLTCRRIEDTSDDLWTRLNVVQENLVGGGLSRRSPTGRLTRTRGITAIRQNVRLNVGLWDLAASYLAA